MAKSKGSVEITIDNAENRARVYKRKRVPNLCLELFIKVAMAVRSHSTACDDGTFMFPKEFIAQGKCKRTTKKEELF